MAENKKISRHIFIDPIKKDIYDKKDVNEKMVLTNGDISVGFNDFNANAAYVTNDKKNVLQFRGEYDESSNKNNVGSILGGRTETKIGEVTKSGSFSYNGGTEKNIPNYFDNNSSGYGRDDSISRKENVYKVGEVAPNYLRNMHDESQE